MHVDFVYGELGKQFITFSYDPGEIRLKMRPFSLLSMTMENNKNNVNAVILVDKSWCSFTV